MSENLEEPVEVEVAPEITEEVKEETSGVAQESEIASEPVGGEVVVE